MNEKELKEFKKILKQQQYDVTHSKEAARALLTELGFLTPKGNIKKKFKPA